MDPIAPKPIFVIRNVDDEDSFITCLEFVKVSENNFILICGTNYGSISIWSLSTYRRLNSFHIKNHIILEEIDQQQNLRVNQVFYLKSKKKLIVQVANGDICLFNFCLNDFHISFIKRFKMYLMTFSKCFLLLDQMICFPDPNDSKQINLLDIDEMKTIKMNLLVEEDHDLIISIYAFFLNDQDETLYILIAYGDGFLILFQTCFKHIPLNESFTKVSQNNEIIYDSKLISTLRLHQEMITCFNFNENSLRGIGCCAPNEIVLWKLNVDNQNNLSFDKKIKRIQINSDGIVCCSIRDDGRIFTVADKVGRIRLYALKSGKPLVLITYHSDSIETIRFSLNFSCSGSKKYLLGASSRDKSISLWSLYNDENPI